MNKHQKISQKGGSPSIVWAGSGGYWKELMLDGKNQEPIVVEKS